MSDSNKLDVHLSDTEVKKQEQFDAGYQRYLDGISCPDPDFSWGTWEVLGWRVAAANHSAWEL